MFKSTKKLHLVCLCFFAVTALVLVGIALHAINKQASIYPYTTSENYFYPFDDNKSKVIDIELNNGQLTLPDDAGEYQTAFLKVDVETTAMGKVFLPCVEMVANGSSATEYFEHGARGTRYLNLSRFLAGGELAGQHSTHIQLKGTRVSFSDQKAQLVLFKNSDISHSKILVLAPHPDDAEIAAYGLYSSSNDVYVVTVTAGDAGGKKYQQIYPDEKVHYLKKGKVRTWNSITVPMLGGVPSQNILNLGYYDATLASMYKKKPSAVESLSTGISDINLYRKQNVSNLLNGLAGEVNWHSLVSDIEFLLKEIKPDIIVAPYPLLDHHLDHKFTTVALLEAIKQIQLKQGELYLYSNHFWLNEFFPYGEEGGVISLPPNFDERLYFSRVYSHWLSTEKQGDKVMALDAMNDLRPEPQWRFTSHAIESAYNKIISGVYGQDNSYYKRSVRDNELFFVVDIAEIYKDEILERIQGDTTSFD
jgi:LmbE family N-acetylglucosaminyl deacetylase